MRAADVERLVAPSGDLRVWLEDEAGNADRAKAAGLGDGTAVGVNPPLLRPTTPSPRLRITRATRSGKTLVIRGTIARAATARITATVTRGKRSVRASAKPRKGTWTIRVRLTTPLRRKGTNAITVRYGGQAGYSPAKATQAAQSALTGRGLGRARRLAARGDQRRLARADLQRLHARDRPRLRHHHGQRRARPSAAA